METSLPTPMTARVVMLIYQRVLIFDSQKDIIGISPSFTWK
jgi:hypothetical protein